MKKIWVFLLALLFSQSAFAASFNGGAFTKNGFYSNTDCSSTISEGKECWDTDNDTLYVGNGVTATSVGPGSSSAPSTATYITQTSDATLSAEQALSSLSTGIMRVATTTGVVTSLTDSSGIASNISDETGSGSLVFATSPTFVTPILGTPTSGVATNLTGTATGLTSGITNALKSATTTVDVSAATAPSSGQVLKATSTTTATWQTLAAGGDALTTNPLSQFAATTSSQFAGVISDESGTGLVVLQTSPTFVTPLLGTPTSGTMTNCTFPTLNQNTTGSAASLSISGQSGLMTVTGLASTNRIKTIRDAADTILELGGSYTPTGTWTSLTMVTPVLGTPASGTLTNCTALPVSGITASTSTALGVGSIELGHATDTTLSRSSAGVLAVEGVVVPSISSTNTFTNKRVTKRTGTTTSSATPTINTDNVDFYSLTAQTVDITSFTTNLSGTPTENQTLWIAITGTAARAITWGASFEASTIALPTTTVSTNRLDVGFTWNTVTSKWRCIATC